MNTELAKEVQDKLTVEAHEIIHLVVQINNRLTEMTNILAPKEPEPIDMSKSAIIEALWEQNADRPREEVEAAVVKLMGVEAPHVRGMPFTKEELTGNVPPPYSEQYSKKEMKDIWDDLTTPVIDHVSTDYQHWEQLYYQSQETNKELLAKQKQNAQALRNVRDLLNEYMRTDQ